MYPLKDYRDNICQDFSGKNPPDEFSKLIMNLEKLSISIIQTYDITFLTLNDSISDTLVKDIMTRVLISVDPSTTVYQVAKMMEQGGLGAILVKEDGAPKGIITDRDFAIKIAINKYSLDTPVHKVASYPLQTINSNESILVAADLMSTKKIRKLVVVDDGKVVGIITSTDIVNKLAKIKNS